LTRHYDVRKCKQAMTARTSGRRYDDLCATVA
jgi:hypothetical protein